MIAIDLIRPDELSPELTARWVEIVSADAALDSPFFRPEFTRLVARVREGVEIAVISRGGRPVGFFPFQRQGVVARAVGGLTSDFHGVIAEADCDVAPDQLLHACRLRAWNFDHLIPRHAPFDRHAWNWRDSPYIDLSAGFDSYAAAKRAAGSKFLANLRRKERRLVKTVGSLRFEWHDGDPQIFRKLIEWKSRQNDANRLYNLFDCDWTTEMFKLLLARQDESLRGLLSVLYAGDRPVAVLFGMRSHRVLHSWVAAYDTQVRRVSPGMQLWTALLRAAPRYGVARIDLGKGDEDYKRHLGNGATTVGEGAIDQSSSRRAAKFAWYRIHQRMRASPLRAPLTTPWRMVKRLLHQRQFK